MSKKINDSIPGIINKRSILVIYDNCANGLETYLLDSSFKDVYKELYETLIELSGKYINEVETSDDESDRLCAVANFLEEHQETRLTFPWINPNNVSIKEIYLIGFLE